MGHAFVYVFAVVISCALSSQTSEIIIEQTTVSSEFTESFTQKIGQDVDVLNVDVSAPSSPRDLIIINATETSLTLRWRKPDKPNGELKGYRIYFTHGNFTDTMSDKNEPEEPVKTYVLDKLGKCFVIDCILNMLLIICLFISELNTAENTHLVIHCLIE